MTTPRVSQSGELCWHSPGSCRRSAPPGGAAGADTDSGVTGVTLVTICDDTSLVSCIPSTSVVSAPDYAPSHPLASVTIQTPDSRLRHKNVTVAMNKERSGINWTNLQHGHNSVNTRPCVMQCGVQHQCSVMCHAVWRDTRDASWRLQLLMTEGSIQRKPLSGPGEAGTKIVRSWDPIVMFPGDNTSLDMAEIGAARTVNSITSTLQYPRCCYCIWCYYWIVLTYVSGLAVVSWCGLRMLL